MTDLVYYDAARGVIDHTIGSKMRKELDSLSLDSTVADFMIYASNSTLLPNWWTNHRDICLRKASIENDLLSSTLNILIMLLYNIPIKIIPKDSMVTAHSRTAEFYNTIFQDSWTRIAERVYNDMLVCDKGAFIFIQSSTSASLPLDSVPTGLLHLDSNCVTLTNDSEWPYVYHTERNGMIRLHKSRVIQLVQMPSPYYHEATIGLSFVSRAFNVASLLKFINQHELEVLGGIESSKIIWATSTTSTNLKQAFKEAQLGGVAMGKQLAAEDVYVGMRDPNSKIGVLDLKRFPDGFKRGEYSDVVMGLIALAAGVDQNVFGSIDGAGTTKTASLINDLKSKFKLPSWVSNKLSRELEHKFLPPTLQIQIGDRRSESSETQSKALINIGRAEKLLVDTGTIDVRIQRENAVKNGQLTQQQFVYLELEDGRLESGLPIDTLFFKDEATMKKLLDVGVSDVCNLRANSDNVEEILDKIEAKICELKAMSINSKTSITHINARNALAALQWLKGEYEHGMLTSDVSDSGDTGSSLSGSSEGDGQTQEVQVEGNGLLTEDDLRNTRKGRSIVSKSRKAVRNVWENKAIPNEVLMPLVEVLEDELDIVIDGVSIQVIQEFLEGIDVKGEGKLSDTYKQLEETILSL